MVKKAILLMSAAACLSGMATAQTTLRCYTDETHARLQQLNPDVAQYEQQLRQEIQQKLKSMDISRYAKSTADNEVYNVPIVFHIIHDYGNEYVPDDTIFNVLAGINRMFNRENPDTVEVIPQYRGNIKKPTHRTDSFEYVRYIGKGNIRFHLATKDPNGNPTRGITRRRSYLTTNASDQAKFDLWAPDSYLNIWVVFGFPASSSAAAYALKPAGAAAFPYYDGVISRYDYIHRDNTITHEIGHSLNLDHPWGATNNPGVSCGDDEVEDTPPTEGHMSNGCNYNNPNSPVYDTVCIFKKSSMGRQSIPAAGIPVPSSSNIWGIQFVARQHLTIGSLTIYPTDTIDAPFTILLRHYGDVVDSFSGNVTSNRVAQVVPVDFDVPADSGYSVVFRRNPGALRDVAGTGYRKSIAGAIELKEDNTASLYNYFYNWNISYDTINTTVGKPSPDIVGDRQTSAGISFNTPTRIFIDSVDIYPTDTIGSPFTIELRRNSTVVTSYTGNTTVSFARQRVPVAFTVPAGKDYRIVFAQNPAALRDTPTIQYVEEVAGAMRITSAVDLNNKYGYFYNIVMRYGYFKTTGGRDAAGDALVIDYPDTTNAQNVMDYTYCSKMFTAGQVDRMRAALNSAVAGRSNLITSKNLAATGALSPLPDLPPVADFSLIKQSGTDKVYGCANGSVRFGFTDRSWNDTIVSRSWTFSNGANTPTSTQTALNTITFTQPGWVSVSLTATGNNSGSTTVTRTPIYVADPTPKSASGYYQEFTPDGDVDKWPMFNYYDNYFQWAIYEGSGYYDNHSIQYRNYDKRTTVPSFYTGTPRGDYDDFFSPVFDLSAGEYAANCNLNFMSAGAFRTSNPAEMNDSLIIQYSVNCGDNWFPLSTLSKADIGNNGTLPYEFAPEWMGAWKLQSLPIPAAARNAAASNGIMFRFRFRPGTFQNMLGSGNNFYMDRIHISSFPTGVNDDVMQRQGMVLTPNPTQGGAHLIINGGSGTAQVQVTDVTGKVVYRTEQQLAAQGLTKIEIPASSVAVKGMYMVQLVSGNKTMTEKLVVY